MNKTISYNDSKDHFENAVLRLLSLSKKEFDDWVFHSSLSLHNDILYCLSDGFSKIRPIQNKYKGNKCGLGPNGENGSVLFSEIFENKNYGIAISDDKSIAWLINNNFEREIEAPQYEEEYFEGDGLVSGGYKNYFQQEQWRLEKSQRQVKELINITGLTGGTVLDIGSGYGYFRKALDDAKFDHSGLEISKYANLISKTIYGFDAHQGVLSDYALEFKNKFDIVTLGDVIEHVADPIELLKDIYSVLKPGGFLMIKTPNIDCIELEIFGANYHSFKREHLVYFTTDSIIEYGKIAGFKPYKCLSASHLLSGFVGNETTDKWGEILRGADLIIYLRKQ